MNLVWGAHRYQLLLQSKYIRSYLNYSPLNTLYDLFFWFLVVSTQTCQLLPPYHWSNQAFYQIYSLRWIGFFFRHGKKNQSEILAWQDQTSVKYLCFKYPFVQTRFSININNMTHLTYSTKNPNIHFCPKHFLISNEQTEGNLYHKSCIKIKYIKIGLDEN